PTKTPTPTPGASPISSIVAASGEIYQQDILNVGTKLYIDRTYTISNPGGYEGAFYIRTANDDKSFVADPLLTFTLSQDATVYVAVRGTALSWMSDWTNTGVTLGTTDQPLTIFSKDFSQGTVALGDNSNVTYRASMYVVFVKPAQQTISPTPTSVPGDTDGDGDIDLSDLTTLLTNFGRSGGGLPGDTDGDNDVDLADLTTLLSNFGR
ncbi:hypothetical protein HY468_05995, partial [Candidatus Roizmanbacteria bacterium]|nr:hypothetical protein [Candidatus Roizmanbacteria bacterium]